MTRKTKINLLEGIAVGAGILGTIVLLNGLNQGNSDIVNDPYVQGLIGITATGVVSKLYRESRVKNRGGYDNK